MYGLCYVRLPNWLVLCFQSPNFQDYEMFANLNIVVNFEIKYKIIEYDRLIFVDAQESIL